MGLSGEWADLSSGGVQGGQSLPAFGLMMSLSPSKPERLSICSTV